MQRFHGDEEDALVDGVYLNEESLTQITRLFKVGNPAGPGPVSQVGVAGILQLLLVTQSWFHVFNSEGLSIMINRGSQAKLIKIL